MPEYIERGAVIKKLDDIAFDYIKDNSIQCGIAAGVVIVIRDDVIREAPEVDAVEVVRCKDCTHWSERIGMCLYCYGLHYNAINPSRENDFCSYGEKRANNKNDLNEGDNDVK